MQRLAIAIIFAVAFSSCADAATRMLVRLLAGVQSICFFALLPHRQRLAVTASMRNASLLNTDDLELKP